MKYYQCRRLQITQHFGFWQDSSGTFKGDGSTSFPISLRFPDALRFPMHCVSRCTAFMRDQRYTGKTTMSEICWLYLKTVRIPLTHVSSTGQALNLSKGNTNHVRGLFILALVSHNYKNNAA